RHLITNEDVAEELFLGRLSLGNQIRKRGGFRHSTHQSNSFSIERYCPTLFSAPSVNRRTNSLGFAMTGSPSCRPWVTSVYESLLKPISSSRRSISLSRFTKQNFCLPSGRTAEVGSRKTLVRTMSPF